jgi:hypothetical protein
MALISLLMMRLSSSTKLFSSTRPRKCPTPSWATAEQSQKTGIIALAIMKTAATNARLRPGRFDGPLNLIFRIANA